MVLKSNLICYNQAVNLTCIYCACMHTYMFIQSFPIQFFKYVFVWYYSDNYLFKKTSQLEDHCYRLFGTLWGFVLVIFFHFLRAVQSFLIKVWYRRFPCIAQIIFTALIIFFTACSPFLDVTLAYFLVYSVVFFPFLRTVCFLMKFCTYIIDNILVFYRLKTCMRMLSVAECYFDFFCGDGVFCVSFFIFLKNFEYIFAITLTITQKIVRLLPSSCKAILGSLFAQYITLLVLRNPKYFHVLYRFSYYSDNH